MSDAATADGPDAAPRCYRHQDRTTYVSCQRCGRPICPECQTVAAVGVQCPECVREGHAGMPRRSPGVMRALRPSGRPVVTYALIAICVAMFALQVLGGDAVTRALLLDPSAIRTEPWRLLTSAFLHSTDTRLTAQIPLPLHLLFNMYALFIFGPTIESFLGRVRFLALYLVGALGGSLAMVLIYQLTILTNGQLVTATNGFIQPSLSLGASGAIFALMGGLLAMRKAMGINLRQIVVVVGINVAFGFFIPGIAWEAHLGGLVIGFAVGAIFVATRRADQLRTQVLGIAGVAAAILIVCALCVATVSPQFYS